MGNLVWHEYARFVSISATVYTIWSSFFAIFYRKFFWDFVDGTVRAPGGIQPGPSAGIFVSIIVKAPIIQIFSMLGGFALLALDYPAPFLKNTRIHRSLVLRIIMLLQQTGLAILYYQGTNGAIWSFIAALCYVRAVMKGEEMAEAKNNRGRGGKA